MIRIEEPLAADDLLCFGDWLKQRRKVLSFTREQLAWRVGCSFETIKKIESSDLKPSVQLATLIAHKVDVPTPAHDAFVQFARSASARLPSNAFSAAPTVIGPRALPTPGFNNLPAPLSGIIGRTQELQTLVALFSAPDLRLLTLTGSPGVGKTRLALELAAQLRAAFVDGVCFVPLASISDPALVPTALLSALDLDSFPGDGVAALKTVLRQKRMLLVLDNFEQVSAAARLVTDLLMSAPGLKIVVSSREALHCYGEYESAVLPLTLPDLEHMPAPAELQNFAAAALFIVRVQAVRPTFTVTIENAQAIARLCTLLDGLPLAIEMAADQARHLTPQQILTQLRERLVALSTSARDIDARQQTLRNTIDWSYHRLTLAEQHVLHVLSVFVGGCTTEAAQTLALPLPDDVGVQASHAHVQLEALLDKHLIRQYTSRNGEVRFTLLETIAAYAREQLGAVGALHAIQQRHAAYFVQWAAQHAAQRSHMQQGNWFNVLEQEHNNLRAASDWLQQHADPTDGLQLISALGHFAVVRGYDHEWLERAQGFLAQWSEQNVYQSVYTHSLNTIAGMLWIQGRTHEAQLVLAKVLSISQLQADAATTAHALLLLGLVTQTQGDIQAARVHIEHSLALRRALANDTHQGKALVVLGDCAWHDGDVEAAARSYEQSVALLRDIGSQAALAYALRRTAQVALHRGEDAHAITLCQESLLHSAVIGDKRGMAGALISLACVAAQLQNGSGAINLLSAADMLSDGTTTALLPADKALREANVAVLRLQCTEVAFAEAWAIGRTMSLAQAMAAALTIPSNPVLQ